MLTLHKKKKKKEAKLSERKAVHMLVEVAPPSLPGG